MPASIRNSKGKDEVTDEHHKYSIYPYWAWSPCFYCKCWRPPRCYHCTLCRTCVLKRDHHCFFSRSCIGLHNQKYFTVFVTWATFSQCYALILSLNHYFGTVWSPSGILGHTSVSLVFAVCVRIPSRAYRISCDNDVRTCSLFISEYGSIIKLSGSDYE